MKNVLKRILSVFLAVSIFSMITVVSAESDVPDSSFEAGNADSYIAQVQKNNHPDYNWEDSNKYSKEISSEQASGGTKSLKISMKSGSYKGHYFFFKSTVFKPTVGKWYNLKIFVPKNSKTDKIHLFYRTTSGQVVKGSTYYFSNSTTSPVDTEKILDKGEWITLSMKIPSSANLRDVGVFTESFSSSEDGSIFYMDEYSVTDYSLSICDYAISGEKTLDSSYNAATLTNFKDDSVISNNGGAVTEIVADGQDNSALKITASSNTHITFGGGVDFSSGDWINFRLKSENISKIQIFYDTDNGKKLADELSVDSKWSVVSFKKPDYSKNLIGFMIFSSGDLFIDGIYSSSQPFDFENNTSLIECSSTYFGLYSDYLILEAEDDLQFLKSKFTANLSAADLSVYKAATGKTARFKISDCTIREYKLCVRGDLNGDSAVNSADTVLLKKALLGVCQMENEYFVAADISVNDTLNILDFIGLNRLIVGESANRPLTYSDFAEDRTEALRQYLKGIYGNYTLAGQQFLTSKYPEISCIYDTTGKLPSLMGFDMQGADRSEQISSKVKEAIKWYNECNGIVTFMWHWSVPRDISDLSKGYSSYKYWAGQTDGTTFSIANAVTKGTAEYEYVIGCIDNIAIQLKELEKAGVPVLWRPLHEAAGDKLTNNTSAWYWWGAGTADNYKALWNLIYDRLENYHGLENLIWVWNGQDINWMPDSSTFDIASYDNYGHDSTADKAYEKLNGAISDKMLALSESGHLPTSIDGTKWLYFVGWYTEYIYKASNGKLVPNEAWNTAETLINNYQSEYVITLDELPILTYKNKKGVPAPIQYYDEHGHIEGENPQWQNGEITLEAELADITKCKYYGDEACSGFATVLWVGKDNESDLIFTVDVPEGESGEYIAEVYYAGVSNYVQSVDKWHSLTYNGQSTGLTKFPKSTERITSVRLNITLNSGTNTLGFYWDTTPESGGYVEIDCIKLIKK